MGDWTLEVLGTTASARMTPPTPPPSRCSSVGTSRIMGSEAEDTEVELTRRVGKPYTRDDTAEALEDGKKVRGRISRE